MTDESARFLDADGEVISGIRNLDVVGSIDTPGSPFYAMIPARAGLEIHPGPVLIETDDGGRYPAQIERAEPHGTRTDGVLVSGVLGAPET